MRLCLCRESSTSARPPTSTRNWRWTARVNRSEWIFSCSVPSTPILHHSVRTFNISASVCLWVFDDTVGVGASVSCQISTSRGQSSYMFNDVETLRKLFFFSVHLQVLRRQHLLLPLLPLHPQPSSAGEVPERSGALPHQEDRLRGGHENTMH